MEPSIYRKGSTYLKKPSKCLGYKYEVVFVTGSLLRSTIECKLEYFMGVPGSLHNLTVIWNSSRKILPVIDAMLETGSTRPLVKSA